MSVTFMMNFVNANDSDGMLLFSIDSKKIWKYQNFNRQNNFFWIEVASFGLCLKKIVIRLNDKWK